MKQIHTHSKRIFKFEKNRDLFRISDLEMAQKEKITLIGQMLNKPHY